MRVSKFSKFAIFLIFFLMIISSVFVWRGNDKPNRNTSHRAFYFWKTRWDLSQGTERFLGDNQIDRIYFRFFDVDRESDFSEPRPVAPLEFVSKVPEGIEVIPVIYLKNRVFLSNRPILNEELANNVLSKVSKMAKKNSLSIQEIQIDCDWTLKTQKDYFSFLKILKKISSARVSATIRLHQIKYFQKTGVPPVDRGMLMFYNMGTLEGGPSRISIFNSEDANRYAGFIKHYPLTLDLVLPVFSWGVHSRDRQIIGLIEKVDLNDFDSSAFFKKKESFQYQAAQAGFFHSWYFRGGDEVKFETMTPALTKAAAKLVADSRNPDQHFGTIAFFDLDEKNLKGYDKNDFKKVFSLFE